MYLLILVLVWNKWKTFQDYGKKEREIQFNNKNENK